MADFRNWKSCAVRPWGIAALALGLGLTLAVWGSAGVLAVTPESETPAPAPTAAVTHGDKDGNRIADGLERKMQGLDANAVLRVIVTMAKGKGVAAARAAAGSFTVLRRYTIINGFTATMTRAQIEALAKSPGVVSIYDDIEVKANRADAMQAFGVTQVHTNPLAELTKPTKAPASEFASSIPVFLPVTRNSAAARLKDFATRPMAVVSPGTWAFRPTTTTATAPMWPQSPPVISGLPRRPSCMAPRC